VAACFLADVEGGQAEAEDCTCGEQFATRALAVRPLFQAVGGGSSSSPAVPPTEPRLVGGLQRSEEPLPVRSERPAVCWDRRRGSQPAIGELLVALLGQLQPLQSVAEFQAD